MTLVERRAVSKVPEVTVYFWITKVLSTGMGETTSDYFIHRVGVTNKVAIVGVALVTGIVLVAALLVQFAAFRYVTWIYWSAVVMVSVFGTMAADGVHVGLGIPYVDSSVVFAVVLAAIFGAWHAREKTLSIHSIYNPSTRGVLLGGRADHVCAGHRRRRLDGVYPASGFPDLGRDLRRSDCLPGPGLLAVRPQ